MVIGLLAAGDIAAQEPRLALSPMFGYVQQGRFFDHATRVEGESATYTSRTRLGTEASAALGATLRYRVARSWSVEADFLHGDGRFEYRHDQAGGGMTSEYVSRGTTAASSYGLSLLRHFRTAPGPVLHVGAGGTIHNVRIGERGECPPPSSGVPCAPTPNWVDDYTVRSVTGRLAAEHAVTRRVAVRLGIALATGRVGTENMWVDLIPEYDHLEAPRSRAVQTATWTAGVRLGI